MGEVSRGEGGGEASREVIGKERDEGRGRERRGIRGGEGRRVRLLM